MTDETPWQVELVGRTAVIRFFSPPMNYLTAADLFGFGKALDQVRRLKPAAIVVSSAVENQFITHFSVEDILGAQDRIRDAGPAGNHRAQQLLERLADLPQPVIAALGGDTMGFGFELALACDFRISQRGDFRIGLHEVRLGILPGAGGTQRLSRLIGTARALDLIMRARVLTPDEALHYGLVHEVADNAEQAALGLAEEFASLPPTAVAMAKSVIYAGRDHDMQVAQRIERDASYRTKLAPEATIAMQEFVDLPLTERRAWIDRRTHPARF
ncbi:MAG: enoyl-CoA hydratase [Subtercola sp.]|nr:enoyl-CoA hydratase [Subtercola sp.]